MNKIDNIEILEVKSILVKNDYLWDFLDSAMATINYFEDYDLIQREDKRIFSVDMNSEDKVQQILKENTLAKSEIEGFNFLLKVIEKVQDTAIGHLTFSVTPK